MPGPSDTGSLECIWGVLYNKRDKNFEKKKDFAHLHIVLYKTVCKYLTKIHSEDPGLGEAIGRNLHTLQHEVGLPYMPNDQRTGLENR